MMRFNIIVGPVRKQTTSTQKIKKYEMSTHKGPNEHVCSSKKEKIKKD